jgi:hypothetical protein
MIVGETGQGQIIANGLAAVLLGYDVIDLEVEIIKFLRHLAVLTPTTCPLPHDLFERPPHESLGTALGFLEDLASF